MSRLKTAFKALITPENVYHDNGKHNSFYSFFEGLTVGKKEMRNSFHEGFDANTYVYSIINKLATSAASIYIELEVQNKKGEWEEIKEGDFYNFLQKPNPNQNLSQLIYEAFIYYQVTGNLVYYGIKPEGTNLIKEVSCLTPLRMMPNIGYSINGAYAKNWTYNVGSVTYNLLPEEIKHAKMFNSNKEDVFGMSPLQAAYKTLVASNEIILADASLIKNRGAIGMLSNKGDRPLTKDERDATDNALKSEIGGGKNFGSIKTTSGNFDFINFAMSPSDLKILESGIMKLRDLCNVYSVSSKLFNDTSASSYNNLREDMKAMYNAAVLPILETIIDAFSDFIIQGWNERDGKIYRICIDYDSIDALQDDLNKKVVAQKIQSETINAILTGIGTNWSEESAIMQLMKVCDIDEQEALILVSNKPTPQIQQPNATI